MELLNKSISNYKNRPIKILQYGEGNFLRGFVDHMIDVANEAGVFDGAVVIVKPIEYGSLSMFHDQECQYTLSLRGKAMLDNNLCNIISKTPTDVDISETKSTTKYQAVPKKERGIKEINKIITCVSDAVDSVTEYNKYADYAKCDTLRFIVSNTTEAGIVFDESDKYEYTPPRTYPGKLTKFLYERYTYYKGDKDKGLIIIPCELIEENGDNLKRCVRQLTDLWKLPKEFKDWVDESCTFCSTLVDRIVTGYPRDEAEVMCKKFGYKDNLIVTGELFALWVIESDNPAVKQELPLDMAGLPVIYTNDQRPYRERKVRILNGAHTSFVLASYLAGNDFVKESMEDDTVRSFMTKTVFDEIIPTLSLREEECREFAAAVIGRFENPFIRHKLLDISLNSVSKWKARCKLSLIKYIERFGKLPQHLTFSIAALISFYSSDEYKEVSDNTLNYIVSDMPTAVDIPETKSSTNYLTIPKDGVLTGRRGDSQYQIKDDADILEFFANNANKPSLELASLFLGNEDFLGEDMTKYEGLTESVSGYLDNIKIYGMRRALEDVIHRH